MRKQILLCGAASLAAMTICSAKDFPLEFKTIPADEVMAFPGGAGTFAQLKTDRPAGLKREPKPISAHPLYGQVGSPTNPGAFVFRLDETKGDGKGYDRLILDLNENHDLTDDLEIAPASVPASSARRSAGREHTLFGPIQMPADKAIAGARPIYFADFNLYSRRFTRTKTEPWVYLGNLRFKSAWYLEARVEIDGLNQKLALYDGNANVEMGDPWKPYHYSSGARDKSWYFSHSDYVLQDHDGSGRYDADFANSEGQPLGPILYLGAVPYQLRLAQDRRSVQVDPWPAPLAEVTLSPYGEQVDQISLAWESSPGDWLLIKPGIKDEQIKVPPGNYRLYSCVLSAPLDEQEKIMASATRRVLKDAVKFEAGKTNSLACGAPLEVQVTAELQKNRTAAPSPARGIWAAVRRWLSKAGAPDQRSVLRINASVTGAGDEPYSSFFKATGKQLKEPPKPRFSITTSDGKEVAAGNLEFG